MLFRSIGVLLLVCGVIALGSVVTATVASVWVAAWTKAGKPKLDDPALAALAAAREAPRRQQHERRRRQQVPVDERQLEGLDERPDRPERADRPARPEPWSPSAWSSSALLTLGCM